MIESRMSYITSEKHGLYIFLNHPYEAVYSVDEKRNY